MLPRRLTLPPHAPAELNPSPSHSCELFCAPKKVNPYQISNFQTLFAKHRGGCNFAFTPSVLFPPSHAPRSASIPSALNQLRILPVATGVYPHIPSHLASLFQPSGSSIEFSRVCRLFALSLPCFSSCRRLFSIACSLFSENSGGWGVLRALPPLLPLLPLLPLQQC